MSQILPDSIHYSQAIAEIVEAMPLARRIHLYEFALFLKSHPLPNEDTLEAMAADELAWNAQFEATDANQLEALAATVEAEIHLGQVAPMFDEQGQFIERR